MRSLRAIAILAVALSAVRAQTADEALYLQELKQVDRPADPSFVPAVLKAAQFYSNRREYRKAADVLSAAFQQQSRAFVDVQQSVPILEHLDTAYWSMNEYAKDAEVLGKLADAASRDAGANSRIVARYLIEQAVALENAGDVTNGRDVRQRARQIIRSLSEVESHPQLDNPSNIAPLAPEDGPSFLRLGHGVSSPKLLKKLEPIYTTEALHAHLEGTVILRVVVNAIGVVDDVTVTHSLGKGLDEAAIAAARRWEFEPGLKDGKPVAVIANIEVRFHLSHEPAGRN